MGGQHGIGEGGRAWDRGEIVRAGCGRAAGRDGREDGGMGGWMGGRLGAKHATPAVVPEPCAPSSRSLCCPACHAMPGAKKSKGGQSATHFSFADIAMASSQAEGALEERILQLASSQGMTPAAGWSDTAEFVLAAREEVEYSDWCARVNPRVFVRCAEGDNAKFRYGVEPSQVVATPDIPVAWDTRRDGCLELALRDILTALSHGGVVVVHCERSFHRGPLGLMAVFRRLFDMPAEKTKALIFARRIVWEGFDGGATR